MDRKAAKELLHIQGWFLRVDEIVQRGRETYLDDGILQEAGDSLMMKLGEAANDCRGLECWSPMAWSGHLRSPTGTSSSTSTTRSIAS
jgi:hypothetical protein